MTTNRLDAPTRNLWLCYALATLGVGLLLSSQLYAGDEWALPLKLLSFMLLLLTFWRWSGALLLVGLQGYLFLREPRAMTAHNSVGVVVFALLGLLLVMIVSRLRTLLQTHSVQGVGDWFSLFQGEPVIVADRSAGRSAAIAERSATLSGSQGGPATYLIGSPATHWLRALVWVIVSGVLCVATATGVLWLVPLDYSSQRNLRLTPTGLRTIQIAFLLATTCLVVAIFVGELLWRRLSPAQARLYLLSSMTSWIGHDMRWAVRRRQRMRRQAARRHRRASIVSKES